jgi:2-phospho-L-lactate transferase/gluconeogenesis factor (CofD/UPF0052 family)
LPASIAGVAKAYEDFLDVLIVDDADQAAAKKLASSNLRVQCTNTIMATAEDRANLAKTVVSALGTKDEAYVAAERK